MLRELHVTQLTAALRPHPPPPAGKTVAQDAGETAKWTGAGRSANRRHADICTASARGRRSQHLLPKNNHGRRARLRRLRRFMACNMTNVHTRKYVHVRGEPSTPRFTESAPLSTCIHIRVMRNRKWQFLGGDGVSSYKTLRTYATSTWAHDMN